VSQDKVRVLVEEAERADQIDPAAAQKQLDERKAALAALKLDDPDYERVRVLVEQSSARVRLAGKK
jgi:F0F1-type ATP synthase epsilon subunit